MSLVDLSYLTSVSGGDKQFVNDILQMFLDHTMPELNALKGSIASQDYATASVVAHRIKSSINMLGNADASALIVTIEKSAKTKSDTDQLMGHFESIEKILSNMAGEIKGMLQTS